MTIELTDDGTMNTPYRPADPARGETPLRERIDMAKRRAIPVCYDRMVITAIHFYVKTGNPAELNAAYWYARYAVRAANGVCQCGCGSTQTHQEWQ